MSRLIIEADTIYEVDEACLCKAKDRERGFDKEDEKSRYPYLEYRHESTRETYLSETEDQPTESFYL